MAAPLHPTRHGRLEPAETAHAHIVPFPGANLDPRALAFTGIDPYHPFRLAVPERKGLEAVFAVVRRAVKASGCRRAILVGHNANFDLGPLNTLTDNGFSGTLTLEGETLGGALPGTTPAKNRRTIDVSVTMP